MHENVMGLGFAFAEQNMSTYFLRKSICSLVLSHFLLSLGIAGAALGIGAQASAQQPANDYRAPVYFSSTKSYFELVHVTDEDAKSQNVPQNTVIWGIADRLARARTFKGVHGRLAVMRDVETFTFLLSTFQPNYAWIGLRYWCNARQAQWSDGKLQMPGDFQAWARNWYRRSTPEVFNGGYDLKTLFPKGFPPGNCPDSPDIPYLGVLLLKERDGYHWTAWAGHKGFDHYLCEYPTGKP